MILFQIIVLFSSITVAWFNEIPVRKMRDFGASMKEEKEFHLVNFMVLFWFNIALTHSYCGLTKYFLTVLAAFIQWLVFDIALNYFTDKPLFYVGNTATTDKQVRKKYAGQIKAGLCIVLISALNVLYYCL